MSLPITMLCGLDRTATAATGRGLLGDRPGHQLVMHCLDQLEVGGRRVEA